VFVCVHLWFHLVLVFFIAPAHATEPALDVGQILGDTNTAGFARADQPRTFVFPADHGPHPGFRNEWWYFTGNLDAADGRRFGYELTLFRAALSPDAPTRTSHWAANQVYLGHFAVTDVEAGRFHYFQRVQRGAVDLAGAQAEPLRVWVEDWEIKAGMQANFPWRLHAKANGVTLNLELTATKPVVLQGDAGLSQKSATSGNASYYYSIPRLDSRGTLVLNGQTFNITGQSWLDREWSTSALAPDQVGWDWFALQLGDGYDLMFYQLRRKDGSTDLHSAGTLIDPAGRATPLKADDVRIEVLETWRSPKGGTYPARWRLHVRPADLTLEISPLLANQELDVVVRYWEGAVDVTGRREGRSITGRGYVELTGYALSSK